MYNAYNESYATFKQRTCRTSVMPCANTDRVSVITIVHHYSYSTIAMSAVNEHKATGSGIMSLAAGMASSSSDHRKSSGSSGSPVPASSLPPTELFPMEGLLEELLHQEAELWRRNELLMQSLRRECMCRIGQGRMGVFNNRKCKHCVTSIVVMLMNK